MQTVAGTAEKDSADVKEDTKMQETKQAQQQRRQKQRQKLWSIR